MQRYISSELTHFVGRGLTEEKQYKLLLKIVFEGFLSHPPHSRSLGGNIHVNLNALFSKNEMYNPEMVCFCDIPFEDLSLHMSKYSRFGLAFGKEFIISKGGKPVMYIPKNAMVRESKELSQDEFAAYLEEAGEDLFFLGKHLYDETEIGGYFDKLIREYHKLTQKRIMETAVSDEWRRLMALNSFLGFHIFSFIKFFDPTLADNDPNNFYFEREWRVLGNVDFKPTNISRIVLPKEFAKRFRMDFPNYFGQVSFSDLKQTAT